MKILCSITYFDPYVSGLSIYAKRLAQIFQKRGHDVTVLTMSGQARSRRARQVEVIVAKPLITISKGFLSFDWIVKSWQQVTTHDVVVVHLPQVEGWIPALFARLMGKRVISIYHCEVLLPEGFLNAIVQTILEIANTVTLWLSSTVVTYTTDYANHSRLLKLVKHKVVALYPPIPTPKSSKNLVEKYTNNIGKSDVVIGVAARLATEKGIEYLIEALPFLQKKLPKQRVTIAVAGPISPVGELAYKTTIMHLVKKYTKQVIFLGEIPPEQMGSFYTCIDVLAVPSINKTEAFGLVQVEAMMMGKPVVVTNLFGVRVPVQKTGMGIVVPVKNSLVLSQAIARVVRNPLSYSVSRVDIKRMFSIETFFHKFEKLL